MSPPFTPAELFPALSPAELAQFEQAPVRLLEIDRKIDLLSSLAEDDARFVDTLAARGNPFRRKFFRTLGYNEKSGDFEPKENQHLLFIGHIGCGKSTELTRLAAQLHAPDKYWVIRADITSLLDTNDLKYYEVWLAIAKQVIESVLDFNKAQPETAIHLPEAEYGRLRDWLTQVVREKTELKELTAHLETSAQLGGTLPFLGGLLAKLTSSVKAGSTYRDIVRQELNKGYSEFIDALNTFLASVTQAVIRAHQGRGLLLVIDGLDRLKQDDWREFFVANANQIVGVRANVVYTAPMALKASGELPGQFQHLVLPMIKLLDFDSQQPFQDGYQALRRMVLLRANYRVFSSLEELDHLIEASGGHLRGLLQLISHACIEADDELIDGPTVERAIKALARSYRDWLRPEHYQVLFDADQDPENTGRTDLMTELVDRGALLEYNEGSWRLCHPAIRTLVGYQRIVAAHQQNHGA